jgi:hypothetical protein
MLRFVHLRDEKNFITSINFIDVKENLSIYISRLLNLLSKLVT